MNANKKSQSDDAAPKGAMPEMPEPAMKAHSFLDAGYPVDVPDHWTREQVEADRRACYLAGIAAARGELPVRLHGENEWVAGHNACREATLANLRTLEEGLKEPAMEQEAKK